MLEKIKNNIVPVIIGIFILGGAYVMLKNNDGSNPSAAPHIVDVQLPQLSEMAKQGEELFNANCATCHGDNAGGTDNGPSLILSTYNPGHHADEAFFRAAQYGVTAHHWPFGNMPAITTVNRKDVEKIVRYIRELQIANGITRQEHVMQ